MGATLTTALTMLLLVTPHAAAHSLLLHLLQQPVTLVCKPSQ